MDIKLLSSALQSPVTCLGCLMTPYLMEISKVAGFCNTYPSKCMTSHLTTLRPTVQKTRRCCCRCVLFAVSNTVTQTRVGRRTHLYADGGCDRNETLVMTLPTLSATSYLVQNCCRCVRWCALYRQGSAELLSVLQAVPK